MMQFILINFIVIKFILQFMQFIYPMFYKGEHNMDILFLA